MYEYNTLATFAKKRDKLKRNIAIGGGIATLAGIAGVALLMKGKGGKGVINTLKNTASKTDDVVAHIPVKKAATELKEQVQNVSIKPPAPVSPRIPTKPPSTVLPTKPPETLQTISNAIKKPKTVGNLRKGKFRVGNTKNSSVGGFTRIRNGRFEQVSGYTRKVQVVVDNLTDIKSLQPRPLSPEGLAKYKKLLEKRKNVVGRGRGTGIKKLKRELNAILRDTPNEVINGKEVTRRIGRTVADDADNINAIKKYNVRKAPKATVKQYQKRSSELSEKLNTLADIQRQMDEVYISEGLVSPRMKHQMNSGLIRMRADVKKNLEPKAVTVVVDKIPSKLKSANPDDIVSNPSRRGFLTGKRKNPLPEGIQTKIDQGKEKAIDIIRSKGEALETASNNASISLAKSSSRRGALSKLRNASKSALRFTLKQNLTKRIRSLLIKSVKNSKNIIRGEKYYKDAERVLGDYLRADGKSPKTLTRDELFEKVYEIAKEDIDKVVGKAKKWVGSGQMLEDMMNVANGNKALDRSIEASGVKNKNIRDMIALLNTLADFI